MRKSVPISFIPSPSSRTTPRSALLTGADPSHLGNSGAPTVVHVLEVPIGGIAPITTTQWDFAFLRGYYDARRNLHTSAQRSSISDSMTKDLHGPQHK